MWYLAVRKGFASLRDYQEHLAKERGYASRKDQRDHAAREKGFASDKDYREDLARKRQRKAEYLKLSQLRRRYLLVRLLAQGLPYDCYLIGSLSVSESHSLFVPQDTSISCPVWALRQFTHVGKDITKGNGWYRIVTS